MALTRVGLVCAGGLTVGISVEEEVEDVLLLSLLLAMACVLWTGME